MNNIAISEVYKLGNKLGLNKNDVDFALENPHAEIEKTYSSTGPTWYPGGRYGSISITEF